MTKKKHNQHSISNVNAKSMGIYQVANPFSRVSEHFP